MDRIIVRAVACILGVFFTVAHATDVSGLISTNTTWTAAASPYVVTGNILVDTLTTLTIQPGVAVRLDPAKAIMVKGTLNAVGTAADSIVITKNQAAGWTKLWLKSSSKCRLQYCRIEYADNFVADAKNAAVYDEGSDSVYIGYCTISNNTGEGGIFINGGSATITNNTITVNSCPGTDAGCGGISIIGGSATITNNTVSYNSSGLGAGIFINYASDRIVIANNSITHNMAAGGAGGGIYCSYTNGSSTDTTFYLTNNIISNNSVGWAGGGIYYEGRSSGGSVFAKMANNTFTDNVARSSVLSPGLGGGIHIMGSGFLQTFVSITHNIFANNTASQGGAIYNSGVSAIRFNTITDTNFSAIYCYGSSNSNGIGSYVIRTNNIYVTGYAVYVDNPVGTSRDRDARYNYWNTTNIDTINAGIFDYFDDFSKDILIYKPFLNAPFSDTIAPSAPINLTADNSNQPDDSMFVINWTNPPDASGISEYYYKIGSPPVSDFDTNSALLPSPPIRGRFHAAPDTVFSANGMLYVWLVDSSGNLNYRNNASVTLTHSGIRERKNNADVHLVFSLMPDHVLYYELPGKARVSLVVLDLAGRLVKHLYSGTREQGRYTQTMQENDLSNGIYYIRFQAGDFTSVKIFSVLR
jgi:hypothetical protein